MNVIKIKRLLLKTVKAIVKDSDVDGNKAIKLSHGAA